MRIPYSSLEAFKSKASLLQSLLKLKGRRDILEALSRLSGYASYHEVTHLELSLGTLPTVDQVAAQVLSQFPEKGAEEAHRIAKALGLHVAPTKVESSKTHQEQKFEGLYATKHPVDANALSKFNFTKPEYRGMLGQPPFDPTAQAKRLMRHRTPMFYLLTHSEIPMHEDLPKVWEDDFVSPGYTPSDAELSEWWYEHIEYNLYPKYVQAKIPENLTDEERDVLWAFWKNPTTAVSENHTVLCRIPDVVKLAEYWKAYHVQAYARLGSASSQRYTVLVGELPAPDDTAWAGRDGKVSCSIAFAQSDAVTLDEDDNISVWEYSACFTLSHPGRRRARPIALMTGTQIVPFRERDGEFEPVGAGYFDDVMDAHSAMLNDVSQVLKFQYFDNEGYADIDDFAYERCAAITTTSIEVSPDLRGKGLVPTLLNLFIETVEQYPESELDAGWLHLLGLPNEEESNEAALNLGSPGVLIFPVEGTRPENQTFTPQEVFLAQSGRRVKGGNTDLDAERRKAKLTAHFLAMGEQVEADIVVYDPWEYPAM